jgi:hypothetical protein
MIGSLSGIESQGCSGNMVPEGESKTQNLGSGPLEFKGQERKDAKTVDTKPYAVRRNERRRWIRGRFIWRPLSGGSRAESARWQSATAKSKAGKKQEGEPACRLPLWEPQGSTGSTGAPGILGMIQALFSRLLRRDD